MRNAPVAGTYLREVRRMNRKWEPMTGPIGRIMDGAFSPHSPDGPEVLPCLLMTDGPAGRPLPLSQPEDSTELSGFENPGTARPRVRIREHRPDFTT